MSPRLRTHLVTAALFVGLIVVLFVLWSLRTVFLYLLLAGVAFAVYYGLYRAVAARLDAREERPGPPPDDGLD